MGQARGFSNGGEADRAVHTGVTEMTPRSRGSASAEAVLLVPALVALLALVAVAGWIPSSSVNLRQAVNAAARAGSQVAPTRAVSTAEMVLRRSVREFDITCVHLESKVTVNVHNSQRGVRVSAKCYLPNTSTGPVNFGTKSVAATSFEVFDTYIFHGDN
ncbi:MAG: pilus assembly protein [Ilumatobacteraceae bacterium]|nr:pilus assembly protein [Ilumatobacteraceae bacterium]